MNPLQVPLLVCQEGLRPSNFKNPAPDNYVALMHECWDGDMDKRPSFAHIYQRLHGISVQYQQQTDLVVRIPETPQQFRIDNNSIHGNVLCLQAAPLATEKLSDLAAHVNHARRRASVVGKHDFECSHEAMIKKIPIKQSRSKTGSTLVTTEQIKTLRKTYLRGKR
ncbi:hypothetical protein DYB36_006337 [Aphanomyces astaci]|uniref:Serine-threonine/tyrosine-protein kinase catalytic domain-containing protein n=1 Tax=Aphanomyces astaci TaxID=112090 RepID=A0A397ADG4_APHAT|nr:hypothetical protein DYB36_006337 [Aphanomyces astaci]